MCAECQGVSSFVNLGSQGLQVRQMYNREKKLEFLNANCMGVSMQGNQHVESPEP